MRKIATRAMLALAALAAATGPATSQQHPEDYYYVEIGGGICGEGKTLVIRYDQEGNYAGEACLLGKVVSPST